MDRLAEIKRRLQDAKQSGRWNYNHQHQMFVGTTNALEIYELGMIDLGRTSPTYVRKNDQWVESEESKERRRLIVGLGTFLETCREDMDWLIARIAELEAEKAEWKNSK